MEYRKQSRILEIFLRSLRGEPIKPHQLASEFHCTPRSISRDMNDLKAFLVEHQEICGSIEYVYDYQERCYYLKMNDFLTSQELYAMIEVLIGSRAFSNDTLKYLYGKLKGFTTAKERTFMDQLLQKELSHYRQVHHDGKDVISLLWNLSTYIHEKREITIDYYKMDRSFVTHRLIPLAVLFQDYYFYLIAYKCDDVKKEPRYFRVDRIEAIKVHRQVSQPHLYSFDEGDFRNHNLLMWPGPKRTIQFEFSGPSLQAVLDKLPHAQIIKRIGEHKYLIEVTTQGDGIKMWLLSQHSWVKVVAPKDFVEEMKTEINSMLALYQ